LPNLSVTDGALNADALPHQLSIATVACAASHYKDFSQLYTDGSKMGNEVAAAVVHGNVTKTTRLPN